MGQKELYIIILLILPVYCLNAQGWIVDENSFEKNWNASFLGGPSLFLGELTHNGLVHQSNQQMGFSYGFDLSKMIAYRLHLGFDYRLNDYNGINKTPDDLYFFTSYKDFNTVGKSFIPNPVKMTSKQESYSLFLKYNLPNFRSLEKGVSRLNPYLIVGAGIGYTSAMAEYFDKKHYIDTNLDDPFFEKGKGEDPLKEVSFVGYLGTGINYQMSKRLFFSFDIKAYYSSTDLLNGVYNFNESLTPNMDWELAQQNSRIQASSIYLNFSFGISYYFNFEPVSDVQIDRYPWFEKQYRSYYSKQLGSEHKWIKQRRYPFYQDKFKKKSK